MYVLLADDEQTIRITLGDALRDAGHRVVVVEDGSLAWKHIQIDPPDVVISDNKMPGIDGTTLLANIQKSHPKTDVIMITGYGTVDSAVTALRSGAYDYILKPFLNDEVVVMLERLQTLRTLREENEILRETRPENELDYAGIIGISIKG